MHTMRQEDGGKSTQRDAIDDDSGNCHPREKSEGAISCVCRGEGRATTEHSKQQVGPSQDDPSPKPERLRMHSLNHIDFTY